MVFAILGLKVELVGGVQKIAKIMYLRVQASQNHKGSEGCREEGRAEGCKA